MKTWFITGCSSGIGKAIVQTVLAKGDRAVVTARSTGKLQELKDAYSETCLPMALEASDNPTTRIAGGLFVSAIPFFGTRKTP